jgi:hypothetical protein
MHTLPDLPASVARDVFATPCAGLPPPCDDAHSRLNGDFAPPVAAD